MPACTRSTTAAMIFLRVALAAVYLSAVADRFGLWGPAGTPGVGWGSMDPFLAYTGKLLWFLPAGLIPAAGWAATILEIVLAIGLLIGFQLRATAFVSGALILVFAVTMTIGLGPEPPLSYSVWTASAASFLLASLQSEKGQPAPVGAETVS